MALTWEAPGRGQWSLELSHFGGRFTPFFRDLYEEASCRGMRESFARYGLPADCMQIAFVNDRPYTRIVPKVEPPAALSRRPPPAPVVWALTRVVPTFRRAGRVAASAFALKLWREELDRWEQQQKPAAVAANLALQDEDVTRLSDTALADHLRRAIANSSRGVWLHFDLVPADSVPVGDFLAHCEVWGIPAADALGLLRGASPASAETLAQLEPVARAIGDAPVDTLDDVRALGPDVASALDDFLRSHGHRAVSSYDVDGLTLVELPQLVLAAIRGVARGDVGSRPADADAVRSQVPVSQRVEFDDLLAEARRAYGVRDDNAGITLQWTVGLLRRAVLEAGRRLVERRRLTTAEDVFELSPAELLALFDRGHGPSAPDVATRAERRRANNAADAPRTLGPDEPLPPTTGAPAGLARLGAAMVAYAAHMYTDETRPPLSGTGIGRRAARGRARTATTPEEALDRLEPGDVLVAPFTTPAYNAVLPILAGLVVEEGGALSHAAIVAREFDIPAVIGVRGAATHIPDLAQVEVDPRAGRVTILNDN